MCFYFLALFSIQLSVCMSKISSENVFSRRSNFISASKCRAFVDKSLMIKEVLTANKTIMITAPPGFGKTTNLHMLKTFLSIPVDDNGTRLNPNETYAHSVFKTLTIYKDKTFFYRHFGVYPVLYLDLRCKIPVTNVSIAIQVYKRKIHECFKEHRYLTNSEHLDKNQKSSCKSWICDKTFKTMSEFETHTGLRELAKYLYLHFNSSVILLMDDFDSIMARSLFVAQEREIVNIAEMMIGKLSPLLKPNDYIGRAVTTGISYLEGAGLLDFIFLESFRFLENHPFVEFYGFTKPEVDKIFDKFNLDKSAVQKAFNWYDGYNTQKGEKIFSPLSILNFINSSYDVSCYHAWNGSVPLINNALKVPQIKEAILLMIQNNSLQLEFVENIWVNDVLILRSIAEHQTNTARKLYLSFLFEQGFLTFTKGNSSCVEFPNREVKEVFRNKLA